MNHAEFEKAFARAIAEHDWAGEKERFAKRACIFYGMEQTPENIERFKADWPMLYAKVGEPPKGGAEE